MHKPNALERAAFISPNEEKEYITELKESVHERIYREIEFPPEIENIFNQVVQESKDKLISYGVNPKQVEDIEIDPVTYKHTIPCEGDDIYKISGLAGALKARVIFQVTDYTFLTQKEHQQRLREVVSHEMLHTATKKRLGRINAPTKENDMRRRTSQISIGFEKTNRNAQNTDELHTNTGGLFTEPTAIFFSLDSVNTKDHTVFTGYDKHIAFFTALLKTYAERTNISELDAFRYFSSCNANQDPELMRKLVEVFDTDTVRAINNIKMSLGLLGRKTKSIEKLEKIAELGNFGETYKRETDLFHTSGLTIEGIKGRVKYKKV